MNLLVFVGRYNIITQLMILLSSTMKRSDRRAERIGVGAKFGCANQFPCYLDLISLLFAVIPLLIPLLIPLYSVVDLH